MPHPREHQHQCPRNLGDSFSFSSVVPGGPAGSIYTTADDMSKWMNFNLGNGSISNGSVVIPEKYFTELHKGQTSTPFSKNNLYKPDYPISDMTLSYCLGWMSSVYRGKN